ncbi:hypothetical protein DM02DRAFT_705128 [Periconia macrospinosa]|uniref:Nucleic acid-binding protein n=1 Tax=Periconia macrospinosa TaxID=97972 RepID=A0A2V1DX90_9PLEO|nr:hypothetical protein DM02DRAFT_705128 [Periconia macrospinosa]
MPSVSGPLDTYSSSTPESQPEDGLPTSEQALLTQSMDWQPSLDYQEVSIASLQPGPQYITLMGRIVNFYDAPKPSKRPKTAQGYVKIMVADDTGAMTVRLWYADINWGAKLRLGMLVSIWTVHVSHGSSESLGLAPRAAPLFTSMFPEGERHCHFMIHERSDDGTMFKQPFKAGNMPGLMTLEQFLDGGFHVDECKLMVCVKNIGARKNFTRNSGESSELITVGIFDDTAEATFTLYDSLCSSATTWIPSHTVLLIASPRFRTDRVSRLSLGANTQVHIDPDMADARFVRALSQRLSKKEHVNPPFPSEVFDVDTAETAVVRILFKLSEIDEFARSNPREKVMGYISVIIAGVHIVTNYKRNMLMGTECCGMPIFANSTTEKCRHCGKMSTLRINPRILGNIVDETGQIESGKLIFSNAAWEQLLGRTAEQLVSTPLEVLTYLEHRLMYLRLTLGFGLYLGDDDIGRLAIWTVKM